MSIVLSTSDWICDFADDYVATRTALHLLGGHDLRTADAARTSRRPAARDARAVARHAESER